MDGVRHYRLSPAQQWMLLVGRRAAVDVTTQQGILEVPQPVDLPALERAVIAVLDRHRALTLRLHRRGGIYSQRYGDDALEGAMPMFDASSLDQLQRPSAINEWIRDTPDLQLMLAGGRLASFGIIRTGHSGAALLLRAHHLVVDWWSMTVLVRDISELYRAASTKTEPRLPQVDVDFAAYADGLAARVVGREGRNDIDYWVRHLSGGEICALTMDAEREGRPRAVGPVAARVVVPIDRETTDRLRSTARSVRSTMFAVVLAAAALALGTETDSHDVVVPTELTNRPRRTLLDAVGCFVATVFLRVQFAPELAVRQLLDQVRSTVLGALQHQGADALRVVAESRVERHGDGNVPKGPVLFQWRPRTEVGAVSGFARSTDDEAGAGAPRVELPAALHFVVRETTHGLNAMLDFDATFLSAKRVERIGAVFAAVVHSLPDAIDGTVADLLRTSRLERRHAR